MWALRRSRERHRDNEARHCLYDLLRAVIRDRVCDEFLSARVRGRAGAEALDAHHRENRPFVHLRLDRYRVDVQIQLEDTSRALAITRLRSRDEPQGARKASHGALRLLYLAVRYCVVLVDSRIFNVSVSTNEPRAKLLGLKEGNDRELTLY